MDGIAFRLVWTAVSWVDAYVLYRRNCQGCGAEEAPPSAEAQPEDRATVPTPHRITMRLHIHPAQLSLPSTWKQRQHTLCPAKSIHSATAYRTQQPRTWPRPQMQPRKRQRHPHELHRVSPQPEPQNPTNLPPGAACFPATTIPSRPVERSQHANGAPLAVCHCAVHAARPPVRSTKRAVRFTPASCMAHTGSHCHRRIVRQAPAASRRRKSTCMRTPPPEPECIHRASIALAQVP